MTTEQNDMKSPPDAKREAMHLPMHDPLTGLPSQELFADRLMMALALAKRNDWMLAVMFISVDELRRPSGGGDGEGRGEIDEPLLQAVATRMASRARSGDTVSRMADDGLLYLLVNPASRENIRRVSQKVRDRLMQSLVIDGCERIISPRIGIAVYPEDGIDVDTLVGNSHAAMRQAATQNLSYLFYETSEEAVAYAFGDRPE